MKYMLLIHQGTTPTPRDPEAWDALSQDEQKRRLRRLPGDQRDARRHARRAACSAPETATTVRVQDGRTLTTDGPFAELKEAIGGYLLLRGRRPRRRDRARRARSRPRAWAARSRSARSWSGSDPRAGLPRAVGPRPRCADRLPRRLRPRRGGRAGGVRDRRRALAARRRARQPRRAGSSTTARNRAIDRIRRDRTLAAKTRLLEVPEAAEDDDGRRRPSPTSGSSSSSPAAIRRSRPTRRSR